MSHVAGPGGASQALVGQRLATAGASTDAVRALRGASRAWEMVNSGNVYQYIHTWYGMM